MDSRNRKHIPPFYCPIQLEVHPAGDEINQRAIDWMAHQGFCENPATSAKLADANVGGFIARLFPDSSESTVEAITKFHLWGFAFDDEIERMAADRLTDAVDMHGDLMRILDAPHSTVQAASPYTRAFREISQTFRKIATPGVWRRWIDSNRAFALGVIWGCVYRHNRTIPSPDHVTTIRALDAGGGSYATDLVEIASGFELQDNVRERKEVHALIDMTAVLLAWDNDIYSYAVEIDKHVEEINLVTSLAHHWSLDGQAAIIQAMNMRNQVMWCYERVRGKYPVTDDGILERYLMSLDKLIRGHLDWALERTRRYSSEQLEAPSLTLTEKNPPCLSELNQPVGFSTLRWWWDLL
ncbi:terpene synthase family protein [Streptomyces beigongshangae]|uniref:terpene synthase family protein n=1 Tax=Streptomyces beigongshangae TaxID=2841597 RepID=UPI001C85FC89|nr:hypothetical protein [Streptomyces sp. REN17]